MSAEQTAEVLRKKYDLEQSIWRLMATFEHETGAAVASVELRRSKNPPDASAARLESVGLWVAM